MSLERKSCKIFEINYS